MTDDGKIEVPGNAAELRDTFLTDLRLAAIAAGVSDPPVHPGTDWHLLGTAVAGQGLIHWGNIAVSSDEHDILNATGRALEDIRIAEGLPEVKPTGSTGQIKVSLTGGKATLQAGLLVTLPDGKSAKVSATSVVTDGSEIDIEATDTGAATNWPGGSKCRLVAPPINVKTDATVSSTRPLSGGTDTEPDDRKRRRILNARRYKPAGGNWSHYRAVVLDAVGGLSDCFVYPCLGGPSTVKVVPVKAIDLEAHDYTRAPADSLVKAAIAALRAEFGTEHEIVVQAPVEINYHATLLVTIPDAEAAGGNGTGWLDENPWPPLVVADSNQVGVTAVTSATQITVGANTATAPVQNKTHVSWWSTNDKRFRTFLVTAVSGGSGGWNLTLDKPAVDSTGAVIAVADMICPAAASIEQYGETWAGIVGALGPGQNTSNANLIPRALRMPSVDDEAPATTGLGALTTMQAKHPEITAATFGVSTSTGLPSSVAFGPRVLTLGKFAIYEAA